MRDPRARSASGAERHAAARARRRAAATGPRPSSRERILEAATRLFAERGYSATGIEILCRRAGIVRTALYWHFGSKEGLLAAVLDRAAHAWIEEIRESAYQTGDVLGRLDRALAGMRAILEEKPELFRLLLTLALERAGQDAATRRMLRRVFRRAEETLVRGAEDALGTRVPDLDLVAHGVLAQLAGAEIRRLVDPEGTDLDRLFAELRRTVLLALESRLRQVAGAGPASSPDAARPATPRGAPRCPSGASERRRRTTP